MTSRVGSTHLSTLEGRRGKLFRVQGSGFRVQGSGFKIQGSEFRVQGSGFRVQGFTSATPVASGGRQSRIVCG